MQIRIKPNSFFVFDLDDTLFPEITFLQSGFRAIAARLAPLTGTSVYEDMWQRYTNGENVFQWLIHQYHEALPGMTMDDLLKEYRDHMPDIKLRREAAELLDQLLMLDIPAGLITDGRSITQRNKLKALQLDNYFSDVIISEEFGSAKPDEKNFRYFQDKYPGRKFYYFGDNTAKDFEAPARLGWITCCIKDNGTHIHAQSFTGQPYPSNLIASFDEIQLL
ncbi:HAD family hydrolase [Paraflavitalea soli]|uniref:HAD family hydrolase n=1 Tax=Paraflavitalea soli TaxID=2315862 RepID=A0A3B7MM59_9BACT|nr:HAD family hydrolase [Paraflavitalea soli]AXY75542.1 HAD family hydrolase [Paraflavitalea soli]